MNTSGSWLQPDWPAPTPVRALCSTRLGGCSMAPYDSMNLGLHVGDLAQHVAANRAALQEAMQARALFLTQVHGVEVLQLTHGSVAAASADACFTTESGLACSIMVADCLPVLLTNRRGTWVAAAHAGWRGLAGVHGQGVLEVLLQRLRAPGAPAQDDPACELLAWLGPCIGPQAFAVGAEVRAAFTLQQPEDDACFVATAQSSYLADLAGLARARLQRSGVTQIDGNDSSAPWCTVANAERYFSYRRDKVCGRMAACIWLETPVGTTITSR